MRASKYVRIKKGVFPFSGKVVRVASRHAYPNGRKVVNIHAPTDDRFRDIRQYNENEVEEEE